MNDSPPNPPPRATYRDSNVIVRTDLGGSGIAIRPRQFIASVDDVDEPELFQRALAAVVFDVLAEEFGWERVDEAREYLSELLVDPQGERVRGTWRRFEYQADRLDEMRVIRGLRDRGVPAQPNHVYSISSLGPAGGTVLAPNTLTPNTLTPNTLTPNTLTPNTLTPNTLTPNTLTPNTLTGGWGSGGSCCCPPAALPAVDSDVPNFGARQADPPDPAEISSQASAQVQIHVIDSLSIATYGDGGSHAKPDDLVGEYADPTPAPTISEAYDDNGDGWIDPAAGHGDFIRSLVERICGITTRLWQATDPLGIIDDSHLIAALKHVDHQSRQGEGASIPHRVLSLSLAGYNEGDSAGLPLADQIKDMIDTGWLIVAAAGNNASCRPTFPASLPHVVAVGALGEHSPAWFSNFGPWVDVSAPGVDVLSEFPLADALAPELLQLVARVDHSEETPDDCSTVHREALGDWVTWSGTSFAAPLVAARLAAVIHDPPPEFDEDNAYEEAMAEVFNNDGVAWHPWYGRLIS